MQEIPVFLIVYAEKVVFLTLDFNTWEIINLAYSTTLTPFSSWGSFVLENCALNGNLLLPLKNHGWVEP